MTDFKSASIVEGIQFTAAVGIPNVAQGLFKKRELVTKVTSTIQTDLIGHSVVAGLVKKYGPEPFFVRVAKDNALLISAPEDLEFVLGHSPDLFASDPPAKKAGMSAFQPDALTLSRGELWSQRRAFAEAVLDTASPLHTLAADFLPVVAQEIEALGDTFDFDELNAAFRRIMRRVVFGASARDDTELSDVLSGLMAEGNRTPGKPGAKYTELLGRIEAYLDDPEPGSLASIAIKAGPQGVEPAGQMIHWMFAMGDTLPANLMRALALLATHPEQLHEARAEAARADLSDPAAISRLHYTGGCLAEAMRLFPTTGLFGRVAIDDVEFPNGAVAPAGTQVLIYNLYNHRDTSRFSYANRFAPHEWSGGDAGSQWSFNFMSHGPQGCPGYALSMWLGQAAIARLVSHSELRVTGTGIGAGKDLPYNLELGPLRIYAGTSEL